MEAFRHNGDQKCFRITDFNVNANAPFQLTMGNCWYLRAHKAAGGPVTVRPVIQPSTPAVSILEPNNDPLNRSYVCKYVCVMVMMAPRHW